VHQLCFNVLFQRTRGTLTSEAVIHSSSQLFSWEQAKTCWVDPKEHFKPTEVKSWGGCTWTPSALQTKGSNAMFSHSSHRFFSTLLVRTHSPLHSCSFSPVGKLLAAFCSSLLSKFVWKASILSLWPHDLEFPTPFYQTPEMFHYIQSTIKNPPLPSTFVWIRKG